MEFSYLLAERRSIRAYKAAEAITKEEIEDIIGSALEAPSWKNSETGRYYAVISKERVEEFRSNYLPGFNRERTENVLAFIVTAYEKGISGFDAEGKPTDENGDAWGAYDLGLANENILLRARELGFDTLVMGLRREAEIRNAFSIPDSQAIMSVIAIGKRATTPERPERKELAQVLNVI